MSPTPFLLGSETENPRSPEELVKIIVRADPNPDHSITITLSHRTILLIDPD
jgi:hypothetical protein